MDEEVEVEELVMVARSVVKSFNEFDKVGHPTNVAKKLLALEESISTLHLVLTCSDNFKKMGLNDG